MTVPAQGSNVLVLASTASVSTALVLMALVLTVPALMVLAPAPASTARMVRLGPGAGPGRAVRPARAASTGPANHTGILVRGRSRGMDGGTMLTGARAMASRSLPAGLVPSEHPALPDRRRPGLSKRRGTAELCGPLPNSGRTRPPRPAARRPGRMAGS